MSVDLEELCRLHNRNSLEGHEGFGLVAFTAGEARKLDFAVFRSPLPDNEAHCGVAGKKTQGKRRELARRSVWVVPPP